MKLGECKMINGNMYSFKELEGNKEENIEKLILSILKEQKVSLAQTRTVFNHILYKIEMDNPITL